MLLSNRFKFIFIKTMKTAGTSVEVYYEPYCLPDGVTSGNEFRSEFVSEAGVVGFRGYPRPWPFRSKWYNHMSADEICRRVSKSVWEDYFKFTVVRNPFDKMVSVFFYLSSSQGVLQRLFSLSAWGLKSFLRKSNPALGRDDSETIENFRSWIRHGQLPQDRQLYCSRDRECVDFYIRYENLVAGIETVCNRVGVPFEPERLPSFKSQFRSHHIGVHDFYDRETEKIVRDRFKWEIARFGYDLPRSVAESEPITKDITKGMIGTRPEESTS